MSQISPGRLAANRRNAQKSTGPRTAAGKKRSSQNARKHGLFSRKLMRDKRNPATTKIFQAFLKAVHDDYRPVTPLEKFWVDRVAAAMWRFRRAYRLEAAAIENAHDPAKGLPDLQCLDPISRYENMLDRAFYRALQELRRLRPAMP